MSFGVVSPEVVSISPEKELLGGGSEFLLRAFGRVRRLNERLDDHIYAEGVAISSWEYNMRMSEAGTWLARRLDYEGKPKAEVAAVGVLATAAHFYDVQRQLSRARGGGSNGLRDALTYEACHYNRRIKTYVKTDSEAHVEDLLTALMAAHWIVDSSVSTRDSEGIFRGRVRGMYHEYITAEVLRAGLRTRRECEQIRETTIAEDMAGWDLVKRCSRRRGFPIDVAATEASVYRKCGEYANSGIKRNVLVLCSGLSEWETGGYFSIDPEQAETVYYENEIDQIIADAERNPEVQKVAWEPKTSLR